MYIGHSRNGPWITARLLISCRYGYQVIFHTECLLPSVYSLGGVELLIIIFYQIVDISLRIILIILDRRAQMIKIMYRWDLHLSVLLRTQKVFFTLIQNDYLSICLFVSHYFSQNS